MKAQREARVIKMLGERQERASARVNPKELHAGCPDYSKKEWKQIAGSLSLEDIMDITERVGGSWDAFKTTTEFIQGKM